MNDITYCKAAFSITIKRKSYAVLPLMALGYLGLLCAGLVVILVGLEVVIGATQGLGLLDTRAWEQENSIIERNNLAKVKMQGSVWTSAGMPYPEGKGHRRRIVVLGDSYVWGDGYANANDIWWRQLDRELKRRGYWDVEVAAAGASGAGTKDQLWWLRNDENLRGLDPDLIIVGYVSNDPDMGVIPHNYKRFTPGPVDKALSRLFPNISYLVEKRLFAKRMAAHFAGDTAGKNPMDIWEHALLEGENFDAYKEVVRRLGEEQEALGVPMFAITLPNAPDPGLSSRYEKVGQLFERAAIPFHDILGDFIDKYSPTSYGPATPLKWGINPANGHPGPICTHFYAQKAANVLESYYPSVLGKRSSPPPTLSPAINDWMPSSIQVVPMREGRWRVTCPTDPAYTPSLPVGRKHVLVSFELPVAVKELSLSGPDLEAAEAYLSAVDRSLGYDPGKLYHLGRREGENIRWPLGTEAFAMNVNTLRFVLARKDASADGYVALEVTFHEEAVRP